MKKLNKTLKALLCASVILTMGFSAVACNTDSDNPQNDPPAGSQPADPQDKYTVTFHNVDSSEFPAITVDANQTFTVTTPVQAGSIFLGWYTDSGFTNEYVIGTPVTANLDLYARWKASNGDVDVRFTVTFDSDGGSSVSSQSVEEGKCAISVIPEYAGHQFLGWYLGSVRFDFNNVITKDITLIAKWAELDSRVQSYGGYNESLYVEWTDGAPSQASVQYKASGDSTWHDVDSQLIRSVGNSVARVDVLGLTAGNYSVKVQPSAGEAIELSDSVAVTAYDRSGYAHFNYTDGVGAYNDDGTIKDNTLVIYVTEENKNTVKTGYVDGVEVDLTPYLWNGHAGIGWILNNRAYDSDTARANYGIQKLCFTYGAVDVRLIGTINAEKSTDATVSLIDGLTEYNSTGNGGSAGDNGRMARITNAKNLTIEGVGEDASIFGWGIHFISSDPNGNYKGSGKSFEVRNITFENYPEDAIGMEGQQGTSPSAPGGANATSNYLISPVERCWIHNNVFLPGYCSSPAESDKKEGDGSCDFKRGQYYTLSYNYFEYCHKTNLIGSADASLTYNVTMHHNWWYNCGSRQPLARRANIHFYNNYIYGDANDSEASLSYVTSFRANCLVFSEANYFDGSKNVTQQKDGVGIAWNNMYFACSAENSYVEMTSRTQLISNNCAYIKMNIDYSQFYVNSEQFYYDSVNKVSDCKLDDAVTARLRVMMYAGVNGFGTTETQFNNHTPTSAVSVGEDGLTIDLEPIAKGKVATTVSNIYFAASNGWSSGMKIRGQGITFTLASEAELTVGTSSTGDNSAELVSADGTVIAGKFTGTLVKVLPAGTYIIASGMKDKDTYITALSFADTSASSEARVEAAKTAINNLPATITLSDAAAVTSARMAYDALTSTEKLNFSDTLLTKLENAEAELGKHQVANVITLINAIGTVNEDSYEKIETALKAYDSLPSNLKAQVTNYSTLTRALLEFEKYAVQNVIDMITALEDVSGWTAEKGREAVESALDEYIVARTAYDELSSDSDEGQSQQSQVTNYSKVTAGITKLESLLAEIELAEQQAENLANFLTAIGNVDTSNLTLDGCSGIIKLYNLLTETQQNALEQSVKDKYATVNKYYQDNKPDVIEVSLSGGASSNTSVLTINEANTSTNTYSVVIDGNTIDLGKCIKLESSTKLTLTLSDKMQVSFYLSASGKKINIDGSNSSVASVADSNGNNVVTVTLEQGTHTLTKGDSCDLLYIVLTEVTSE